MAVTLNDLDRRVCFPEEARMVADDWCSPSIDVISP